MNQATVIQYDFGKVSLLSHQILFTEFYSNDNFTIEEAKLLDNARYKLCKGRNFYSLVSLMSIFGHMTKEAQIFLAQESKCKDLISHEVLLIDSLSIRLLSKYFIKWMKPPYKIEVAKNYETGLDILTSLERLA